MCASPDPFTAGGQAIYIHAAAAEMAGAAFTADDLCANIPSAYSAFL
jgi:NAD(P)H-hydrate repair Nnr-like enzyme with NAD(P)H-hydrate dehydratase domain